MKVDTSRSSRDYADPYNIYIYIYVCVLFLGGIIPHALISIYEVVKGLLDFLLAFLSSYCRLSILSTYISVSTSEQLGISLPLVSILISA